MNYDENVFKAKANKKARRIWLVFAILLTANYGADVANGIYPANQYLIFVLLDSLFDWRIDTSYEREGNGSLS